MDPETSNTADKVDVTVHIKGLNSAQPAAVLDRRLVEFLCHVRDTGSVQAASERMHYSPRKAQRMLRSFSDASGLELLDYHGWHGTELTPAAVQCIALYVASLKSVQQIVAERGLPRSIPLPPRPKEEGRGSRPGTPQIEGHARDPTAG